MNRGRQEIEAESEEWNKEEEKQNATCKVVDIAGTTAPDSPGTRSPELQAGKDLHNPFCWIWDSGFCSPDLGRDVMKVWGYEVHIRGEWIGCGSIS